MVIIDHGVHLPAPLSTKTHGITADLLRLMRYFATPANIPFKFNFFLFIDYLVYIVELIWLLHDGLFEWICIFFYQNKSKIDIISRLSYIITRNKILSEIRYSRVELKISFFSSSTFSGVRRRQAQAHLYFNYL